VDARYFEIEDTEPYSQTGQTDACGEEVIQLMDEYERMEHPDEASRIAVCRCLEHFFYPEKEPGDSWFMLLENTVRQWADTLPANGYWPNLPHHLALERIEVMNRYAYMFRE
jgi:hypothetical protein